MGINLGDPVFRGAYHGKRAHDDDLEDVVQRALEVGCEKMMVTGSDVKESAHAIEVAEKYRTSTFPPPRISR
jgi:TatD DNase family protein